MASRCRDVRSKSRGGAEVTLLDSIFEMEDYPKVLNRLQNQCAKREYCSSDIYKKAYSAFDGDRELALKLVESLVADKFVDDLRFASAFAREKSRLSGWGKVKISYMLAGKGIPKDVVDKALEEIDEDEAHRRMVSVLEAKYKTLEGDPQETQLADHEEPDCAPDPGSGGPCGAASL